MISHKTTIYIMRHGESQANVEELVGHNADATLTEEGHRQVKDTLTKVMDVRFDVIISSDFIRAVQTAQIIAKHYNLTVVISESLRERSYGSLNGKTFAMIKDALKDRYVRYEKMSEKQKALHKLVDDMESMQEALERFTTYIREITQVHAGKTILVVCHGTLMRAFLARLGYAAPKQLTGDAVGNASYFKLEHMDKGFVIAETHGLIRR